MYTFPQKSIQQKDTFSPFFEHLIQPTEAQEENESQKTFHYSYSYDLPSPNPSPSSSSSTIGISTSSTPSTTTTTSPIALFSIDTAVPRLSIARKKTTISRKPVTSSLPISPLERRSPAASFLSTFSAPAQIVQEEKGDEIDDYVLDNVIGFGGFSTVRKGYRISDGQKVAIKIIKKSVPEDEEDQILLEREIAIWKSLDHPHIVNVHSVLETDRATYIVADYCAKGHLLDLVAHQGLSEAKAKALFVPLAQAIHYLHSQARVCHKDIKLENVLVDENNIVKLCDFGLAIPCQPTKTTQPAGGSLAYVAPEQILSSTAMGCPKTDVWSLGIVLYTLVTGKLPFAESQTARLQHIILSGQWDMPASLSQELQSLLRSCICIDPEQRFDTQQILASPWCRSLS